jgi:hypothetical protein
MVAPSIDGSEANSNDPETLIMGTRCSRSQAIRLEDCLPPRRWKSTIAMSERWWVSRVSASAIEHNEDRNSKISTRRTAHQRGRSCGYCLQARNASRNIACTPQLLLGRFIRVGRVRSGNAGDKTSVCFRPFIGAKGFPWHTRAGGSGPVRGSRYVCDFAAKLNRLRDNEANRP